MKNINPILLLRYSIAFVVFYFGIDEIVSPAQWVSFVPEFLKGTNVETLVIIHGIVLCVIGLSLLVGLYKRIAALLFCAMIGEVIVGIIIKGGLNPTAARDIAIFGASLAIAFSRDEA